MGFLKDIQADLNAEAMTLYKECHDSLLVEAVGLCKDAHAAEDLVMRTFEEFCKNRDKYDPEKGSWLQWLKGIMRNIHHNASRGKSVSCMVYMSPEELALVQDSSENETGAIDAVLANSDAEIVRQAINGLSKEMREVILLKYFEDLPIAQIAKILKTSEDSIKCRLYYARKILAKRLGEKLGKKPVAIVVALLLSIATAFGAWKAADALGWLPTNEEPQVVETPTADNAHETAAVPVQMPVTLQTADKTISATTSQMTASDNAAATPTDSKENERTAEMNLKTVKTMAVAATAAALATTAQATTYTWTGKGTDANWSTAENWSPNGVPGTKDDVVFDRTATQPDATIDAAFQGQVYNLTLKADYAGTITQARVFKVNCGYVQLGGTFDCATYNFIVGAGDVAIDGLTTTGARDGTFQYHGGTFKNPRGGGLFRYVPRFISSGAKFAIGGENFIQYDDSNLLFGHGWSGSSANFYATNKVFKTIDFGSSTTFYGTNNVMQGTFVHSDGSLSAGAAMQQRTGVASFVVLGDVVVTNKANGGNLPLVFETGEDQRVRFGPETNATAANRVNRTPRSCGFLINKPAGKKVIVTTDAGGVAHFGRGLGTGAACTYGFKVDSGILDMSQAGTFTMGCESTTIDCARGEGTDILWPENAVFLVRNCTLKADYVFNNLEVDMLKDNKLIVPNGQTNVVNGSVTFTGSRIAGGSDSFNGRDTAYLEVHGDLYADGAVNANGGSSTGGSVNLLLNDTTHDQTLHFKTNGYLPNVIVDKPANLKVACDCEPGVPMGFSAGAINTSGGYLQINSGTVVAPTNGIRFYKCLYGGLVQNGGKLDMNGGPVVFSEREATEGSYNLLKAKDELNDLMIDIQPTRADGGWREYGVSVPANTTNVVNGTFTFNRGRFVCANDSTSLTDLRGDFRITSPLAVGGNCPLRFSVTNDQCYTVGEGCTNLFSTITVAKTGGRLMLGSDVDLTYSRVGPDVKDVHYSRSLNLVSGTLDSNGHRLMLPTGNTTVADGFTFAIPLAAGEGVPFLTYGKLALPSAGGPCLELRGKATPEMAQRYDVWTYGTLTGFDAEAWTFRPAANVTRCRIRHDESEKTIYLTCRYRTGFALLLR